GAPAAAAAGRPREPLPEPTPGGEQVEPEEPPSILAVSDHADPPFFGLKEPRGVAVDGQSRIWIADFGHSRFLVFDSEGGSLGGCGGRGHGADGSRERRRRASPSGTLE